MVPAAAGCCWLLLAADVVPCRPAACGRGGCWLLLAADNVVPCRPGVPACVDHTESLQERSSLQERQSLVVVLACRSPNSNLVNLVHEVLETRQKGPVSSRCRMSSHATCSLRCAGDAAGRPFRRRFPKLTVRFFVSENLTLDRKDSHAFATRVAASSHPLPSRGWLLVRGSFAVLPHTAPRALRLSHATFAYAVSREATAWICRRATTDAAAARAAELAAASICRRGRQDEADDGGGVED